MRFAAIADVHGNYLALEAVIADIRAQGIDEIVNLGDMASGPLDARRTMDALMALDAVHVLGNHDRYLIDRPPEKMGSWDRPAHAQLDAEPSRLAARGAADACVPRPGLSLPRDACQRRGLLAGDGDAGRHGADGVAGSDRRGRQGNHAVAHSLRPHPYRARGAAFRRPHGDQSRQRRLARLSRRPSVSACHRGRHAGRALRDPGIVRRRMARDVPPCALRSRSDGGAGARATASPNWHRRWRQGGSGKRKTKTAGYSPAVQVKSGA